jgi:hypothetical protein
MFFARNLRKRVIVTKARPRVQTTERRVAWRIRMPTRLVSFPQDSFVYLLLDFPCSLCWIVSEQGVCAVLQLWCICAAFVGLLVVVRHVFLISLLGLLVLFGSLN